MWQGNRYSFVGMFGKKLGYLITTPSGLAFRYVYVGIGKNSERLRNNERLRSHCSKISL
jgi:hypothetical protein